MSASKPQHTPGPWRALRVEWNRWVVGVREFEIAWVECRGIQEDGRKNQHLLDATEADARIIAAVPDLLECVRQRYAACDCLDGAAQGTASSEEFFDQYACGHCHNDRAALAKAGVRP